ncbi:hypothetical protein CJD36_000990 [Flavipsychrobacter stenotrophus]|uniref:Uncharacterized protein n=1 Tax=Flavipsychrobacter stenotrophus TaxID=2077091 RepID=A0A2S7SZI0_9BACT|nr:hypothetical protein CJD36_000990 [Flavipsychrobacter stenotrophus]
MLGANGFIDAAWDMAMVAFLNNRPTGAAKNDSISQILAKIAYDYCLFGSFCLNIRWDKGHSKIAEINYLSPLQVRIGVYENGAFNGYCVSDDWRNLSKYPFEVFAEYDADNKFDNQILYVKNFHSNYSFYGQPDYIIGIDVIETDYEINTFHLSSIEKFSFNLFIRQISLCRYFNTTDLNKSDPNSPNTNTILVCFVFNSF